MPRTPPSSAPGAPARVAALDLLGRSLFPIVALGLIAGTLLWGPWVTLVLTYAWWRVVTRVA